MKKFLPLILLAFPTASFADVTHTIQSAASVSTVPGASATSESVLDASISVAGTNVTPKANTVAGQIGSLDLADAGITNGVPTVDYDTSFNVVNIQVMLFQQVKHTSKRMQYQAYYLLP